MLYSYKPCCILSYYIPYCILSYGLLDCVLLWYVTTCYAIWFCTVPYFTRLVCYTVLYRTVLCYRRHFTVLYYIFICIYIYKYGVYVYIYTHTHIILYSIILYCTILYCSLACYTRLYCLDISITCFKDQVMLRFDLFMSFYVCTFSYPMSS